MDRCRLANSCNLDQLRDRCSLASFTGTRTSATMELKRKQAHPREPTVTGHSVWTFRAGCLGGGHRQSQPAYRSAQASRHRQDAKNGPEFDHPVLAETNANTSMTLRCQKSKKCSASADRPIPSRSTEIFWPQWNTLPMPHAIAACLASASLASQDFHHRQP